MNDDKERKTYPRMTSTTSSLSRGRWAGMTALGTLLGLVLMVGGFVASVAIATAVMPGGGESAESNPQAELTGYLWPIMSGLGLGLGLGSFQGGVLQRIVGNGITGRWTAATMVGSIVGLTLMSRLMDLFEREIASFLEPFFMEENIMPVIVVALAAGMVVGLAIGVAQAVIGRVVTGVWPAISGVVWGFGFAVPATIAASGAYRQTLGTLVLAPEAATVGEIAAAVAVITLAMALATALVSFLLPPRLRSLPS